MAQIPPVAGPPWYDKEWLIELLTSVPAVIAMGVSAAQILRDPKQPKVLVWVLSGVAVWISVATVVKIIRAKHKDKQRQRKESPIGLEGCIHTLHAVISQRCGIKPGDKRDCRIAIHRIVPCEPEPKLLEQVTSYIGGKGDGKGRSFSINSGIIGKVARTGEPYVAARENDDHEKFIAELVSIWGYTESEARELTSDRKAWMAVPLGGENPGETIGIVYLDSNDEALFMPEIRELVIESCVGVARFINQTYD